MVRSGVAKDRWWGDGVSLWFKMCQLDELTNICCCQPSVGVDDDDNGKREG